MKSMSYAKFCKMIKGLPIEDLEEIHAAYDRVWNARAGVDLQIALNELEGLCALKLEANRKAK